MTEANKLTVFEKILPVGGVAFGLLALFARGVPAWVQYLGMGIGVLLVVAWLVSRASWLGKAITFRLFRSRLSKDQALRLSVLVDDITNHMSYSYTLSPFHVWRRTANKHPELLRMNYAYFHAIQSWVTEIRLQCSNPQVNTVVVVKLLSSAISETNKLAEFAGGELEELIRCSTLAAEERSEIEKSWNSARSQFNQWIDKWQTLFKEINKRTGAGCVEYFRPLESIG